MRNITIVIVCIIGAITISTNIGIVRVRAIIHIMSRSLLMIIVSMNVISMTSILLFVFTM